MKNIRWFLRFAAQPIFSFIAFLLTALSLAVAFVFPVSAADPAPPPSASVPTAEKGGWQVVTLKNGKTMSFSEILKLSGTEKDELINQLTRTDKIKVQEFEYLASNQSNEQKRSISEASNQSNEQKREHLIAKYEQYISNIEKWAKGEKTTLQRIVDEKFVPDTLKKRAQAILDNKKIILSGI